MSKEVMPQALEAFGEIEWSNNSQWQSDRAKVAITALREVLAQPEQTTPKAIKQVLTLHEGWYDVPDGQEYLGTVLERRTVYTTPQPAQQEQGLPQNIPSLTMVLAYLERLVSSDVYAGVCNVIEDTFQREQQPPAQPAEPLTDGIGMKMLNHSMIAVRDWQGVDATSTTSRAGKSLRWLHSPATTSRSNHENNTQAG